MSVQTEITRLEEGKATLQTWLSSNGFAPAAGAKLDELAALLQGITVHRVTTVSSKPTGSPGSVGDLFLVVKG